MQLKRITLARFGCDLAQRVFAFLATAGFNDYIPRFKP